MADTLHPQLEMPAEEDLARLVEGKAPAIQEAYLSAHRLVLETLPDLKYAADTVDGAIGYGARQFGYDGWGMAAVTPYTNWISIAFMRGATLDDPQGVLEGTGSAVRHVKIRSAEQLAQHRSEIVRLLRASAEFNRG